MCWVMPPASPAATSVSRIASSSEVLPWSTWPMIVTTGGRSTRSSSASSKTGSDLDVVGGVDDLDLLVELVGEHLDRVVGERLRERRHLAQRHQLLDHLGHRHAEVLGDVLDGRAGVDADQVGGLHRRGVDRRDRLVVGAAPAPAAARAALGLVGGAALLAARGLRVDHHAPAPAGPRAAGRALARARVARGALALRLSVGSAASASARRRCVRALMPSAAAVADGALGLAVAGGRRWAAGWRRLGARRVAPARRAVGPQRLQRSCLIDARRTRPSPACRQP